LREEQLIRAVQYGSIDLPAQHGELVAQDGTSASASEEIPLSRRMRRMIA
jgi:hypothetical protein